MLDELRRIYHIYHERNTTPYRRTSVSLRYCLTNGANNEIDISSKYCIHQLSRFVGSGVQAIGIRVVEMNRHYLHFIASQIFPLPNPRHRTAVSSIRFSQQQQQQRPQTPHRHSLPLERYTKKQNQELATINEEIHFNQSELKEFDIKLTEDAKKMMDLYRLAKLPPKNGTHSKKLHFQPMQICLLLWHPDQTS